MVTQYQNTAVITKKLTFSYQNIRDTEKTLKDFRKDQKKFQHRRVKQKILTSVATRWMPTRSGFRVKWKRFLTQSYTRPSCWPSEQEWVILTTSVHYPHLREVTVGFLTPESFWFSRSDEAWEISNTFSGDADGAGKSHFEATGQMTLQNVVSNCSLPPTFTLRAENMFRKTKGGESRKEYQHILKQRDITHKRE